jgi:hypothetical protein
MIFGLAQAIQARLIQALAGLKLRKSQRDEAYAAPRVILGALPVDEEAGFFPFVLIRPSKGMDDLANRSEAEVALICGVFTAEGIEGGFNDLLNLVAAVRSALMTQRTLGPYCLEPPIKWRIGGEDDNQPHPHYVASIETKWLMPALEDLAGLEE